MHATHSPGNDGVSKLLSVMITPPLPHPVFDFSSKGVEYSVVCNMKTCNFFWGNISVLSIVLVSSPPHFLNSKDICHLEGLFLPFVAIKNTTLRWRSTHFTIFLWVWIAWIDLSKLCAQYTQLKQAAEEEKSGKQSKKRSLKITGEIWHTSCLQRQL